MFISMFYARFVLVLVGVFACSHQAFAYTPPQDGYCWNEEIGWVDMGNVWYDDANRRLHGSATFAEGTTPGTIQFTQISGEQIDVTVSASLDGNGRYPIEGQAFSPQAGWLYADHGGTNPLAMATDGTLFGNMWSNDFGWFSCSSTDVGATYVHIFNLLGEAVPEFTWWSLILLLAGCSALVYTQRDLLERYGLFLF